MDLARTCIFMLDQLAAVVSQLDNDEFTRPSTALHQATIGQHVRHTLEFFMCLEEALTTGVVNYDRRKHSMELEGRRSHALDLLAEIREFVGQTRSNQPLDLEVGYDRNSDTYEHVPSNYERELAYNIEHTVHHMAFIRIAVREVAPHVSISPEFGVAISTLRFKDSLVNH